MKASIKIIPATDEEVKTGGAKLTVAYSLGTSKLGSYLVASTEKGITAVLFYDGDPKSAILDLMKLWPKAKIVPKKAKDHKVVGDFLKNSAKSVKSTPLATSKSAAKLALHVKATPFQLKVWQSLLKIPRGICATYATVAQNIGQPKSQRAVGTAIGSNSIGYIIPCHRVVKSNGGIGEYRWGTALKMFFIEIDTHHTSR